MAQVNHASALDSKMSAAFGQLPMMSAGPPAELAFGDAASSSSVGAFYWVALTYIWSLGRQAIDTPEERQSIKQAVMALFDTYLAPRLSPQVSAGVRDSIDAAITSLLNRFGG